MAQIIKLKRGTTTPTTSNLANGEVAVDTSAQKFYINDNGTIKEIGGGATGDVVSYGTYQDVGVAEYAFTATSGQQTFSGADDNSLTLGYAVGSIEVFLNGVLLDPNTDYTATNGTSIVLTDAAALDDLVQIFSFTSATGIFQPTKLDAITTVNNQATYSLTYNSVAYEPNSAYGLIVSLNGITQEPGNSYTINRDEITFSPALVTGDVVDYIVDLTRAITVDTPRQNLYLYGKANESISKGDAVMFNGVQGDHILLAKADMGASGFIPEWVIGIANETLAHGDFGYVATQGIVSSIDTSAYTTGDFLYLDPSNPGAFVTTEPSVPNHSILMAAVLRINANNGTIQVRVTHKSDLDELHGVSTSGKSSGDYLQWNGTNWVAAAVSAASVDDATALAIALG